MSFLTGKAPKVQFSPVGASGGGLDTSFSGNVGGVGGHYTTTADATRTAAVGDVANSYGDLADKTAGLSATVAPGYNDLLASQIDSINNSARSAVGNLQQNLQSRRILGSSFGQDTLTRAQAEFSKQRADTTANSFLQSLTARNQLLQQEYQARTAGANTGLNELNLEAGVANGLIGSTNSIMAANAQADAKAEAASQAGAGKFVGTLVGGGIGFMAGGPAGAVAGAGIGSKAMGGA